MSVQAPRTLFVVMMDVAAEHQDGAVRLVFEAKCLNQHSEPVLPERRA
jgi:hypothetical protein